jgi:hypothetical protein
MQIAAPRLQHLDAVTAEIRRVESRLAHLGIHRMSWVTTFGSGPFKQTLSWSEDLESERWRLLYSVFWQQRGPDPSRWIGRSASRPLVDCPGDVRIRSHPFLGRLLRQLGVAP